MSVKNFKFVSPGIFINEIDNTFRVPQPQNIGPVVIGRSQKGLAMTPIKVENYRDFVDGFGETVPGRGGGDVYRNGNNQSAMYGTYAAKAFLQSEAAPLTYIRLLGQQSATNDGSVAAKAGWKTTNGADANAGTGGGAYGLFVCKSSSMTSTGDAAKINGTGSFFLAATFYTDKGAMLLSGSVFGTGVGAGGAAIATVPTAALGVFMDSDTAGNFKVQYYGSAGTAAERLNQDNFLINLDDSSQNFIRRKVNTNPTLLSSGDYYASSAEKDYWLGESYETFVRDNLGALGDKLVGIMLPLASGSSVAAAASSGPQSMKIPSVEAKAGWFISQNTSPADGFRADKMQKLFRLKGRGHGEWLHKNAKVQIDRLRAPANPDDDYGSFSIVIRALGDTDQNQQILERFDNLNLDPTSPNYIARRIGDVYYEWDQNLRRLRRYGSYENQSKYVYAELNGDVAAGAVNPAFLPFGFFGPPKYVNVALSASLATSCDVQTQRGIIVTAASTSAGILGGGTFENAKTNRALSGGFGKVGRILANMNFPVTPLVQADTDASVTNRTNCVFGMRSTRASDSTARAYGLGDIHRMLYDGQSDDPTSQGLAKRIPDPTSGVAAARGDTGEYSTVPGQMIDGYGYVFTMDDIISGSTKFSYASGSHAKGTSLTSTASNDYKTLIDFGYDTFMAPFFGGFDGFDITKPDPLANSLIGSSPDTSYTNHTIRRALETVADPELLDFNLLAVPGITNTSLTTYQVELCEERRDALAVIDLPDVYKPFSEGGVDATSAVYKFADRVNRDVPAVANALRDRRLDSSYGCAFYPWVQTLDGNTGQTVWIPPSVAMMGVFGSSEAKSDVWFAPAGFNRGGLSDGAAGIPILNVSQRLSTRERDVLYDNHINPIASFPSTGIVVFGQKTLQLRPSALDRINVRRLVIFLKKQISVLSTQILFEQNVQATWDRFKGLVEPFLANVKTRYGITEYRLILDETTTTPDLIDQNILYAKIMVKPARAIEFIAIDFIIANTGASFDD